MENETNYEVSVDESNTEAPIVEEEGVIDVEAEVVEAE